jgi:CBS domain-containing protein
MRAKDIMTTPVITVRPETSVKEAAALLVDHGVRALPVVNDVDELLGMVSEADLIRLETSPDQRRHMLPVPHRVGPVPRTVEEIMSREVVALPEDVDAAQIAREMLKRRVTSIPIVSGDRVVGIVARRDILKMLARSDGDIRHELEALLDDEMLMLGSYTIEVHDGLVTLRGPPDEQGQRLAGLLARSVPGVLAVEFAPVSV